MCLHMPRETLRANWIAGNQTRDPNKSSEKGFILCAVVLIAKCVSVVNVRAKIARLKERGRERRIALLLFAEKCLRILTRADDGQT